MKICLGIFAAVIAVAVGFVIIGGNSLEERGQSLPKSPAEFYVPAAQDAFEAVDTPVFGALTIDEELYDAYDGVARGIRVGADVDVSVSVRERVITVNGTAVPVTEEMFELYEAFAQAIDSSGDGEAVITADVAGDEVKVKVNYRGAAVDEHGDIVSGVFNANSVIKGHSVHVRVIVEGENVSGAIAVDGFRVGTFSG